MNSLIQPFADMNESDRYMPEGFSKPDEPKLGEKVENEFLDDGQRETLTGWWLAVDDAANTPDWDFVSTCKIAGQKDLILIEAKAQVGELRTDDCCGAKDRDNRQRIFQAIAEASRELGDGWSLRADRCY